MQVKNPEKALLKVSKILFKELKVRIGYLPERMRSTDKTAKAMACSLVLFILPKVY